MSKEKPAKEKDSVAPKYGIDKLAEDLGSSPVAVRQRLRTAGMTKTSRAWGWDTKADYEAVLKQLKSTSAVPEKAPKPKKGKKKAA